MWRSENGNGWRREETQEGEKEIGEVERYVREEGWGGGKKRRREEGEEAER